MVTNKLEQLREYQKKMAQIEKELASFHRKLAALPAKHGFRSMDAFIDALRSAAKSGGARSAPKAAGGRKPRAKITPEVKQKVKALVGEGKTGSQVAKLLGISVPSVQNIKKELGLVKARK